MSNDENETIGPGQMPPSRKPASCANCKFWRKSDDGGLCHRYPPTPVGIHHHVSTTENQDGDRYIESSTVSFWPETGPEHWCGEFVQRDRRGVAQS